MSLEIAPIAAERASPHRNAERHRELLRARSRRYREKPETKARRRAYHVANRDRARLLAWARRHGLTLVSLNAFLDARGGACEICGLQLRLDEEPRPRIDHDHVTGEIRGILCDRCNVGIGKFGDDPLLLRKCAAYLDGGLPL